MYEKEQELALASFQNWTSKEVFTFGWFLMVTILLVFYAVWLKLVDRKRGTELLLIGSLEAVAKLIFAGILLNSELGLYNYKIRFLPVPAGVFATSVTLSPILIMLVTQYTSSWKGFLLWEAIGNALLNFVIFPLYTAIGILEFHKGWNVFYHFLVLYALTICVRVVFLWITGTQKKLEGKTA
jgi:hypothetical protein